MNGDLERQLDEMGPEYRAVVERLRGAVCLTPAERPRARRGGDSRSAGVMGGRRGPTFVWLTFRPLRLVAATLLLLFAFGVALRFAGTERGTSAARHPAAAREYLLAASRTDEAMREMIRTQNPDGSWQNDFLTCRNAEALRGWPDADARIAYKKAARFLRSKGLLLSQPSS